MRITNTQLAAAVVALGHDLLPSTDFNQVDITFEFEDRPAITRIETDWLGYAQGNMRSQNDPVAIMFEVSKARQWVLDRVIHGNHNQDMDLPVETLETRDLRFAVCLVALQCYLIKLDKPNKTFHFTIGAGEWKRQYDRPHEGSYCYWARLYLRSLDDLVFRIHKRDLARQKNQAVITCERQ